MFGPVGAAAGTVLGGYAGLAVCTVGIPGLPGWSGPGPLDVPASRPARRVPHAGALAVGLSFVAIAVLQSVDLLVANRVLDPDSAAAVRRPVDHRRGRLLRDGNDPAWS